MRRSQLTQFITAVAFIIATAPAFAVEITVSAASSLTNAFNAVAQRYQARHPDVHVWLNFGGSGSLLRQLEKAAPVDVFASADQHTMDLAEQQDLIVAASRRNFARNALVLIVPTDSTLAIDRLEDLRRVDIQRIAIGNPASVPVGRYTRRALQAAGLWDDLAARTIDTQNVRQALAYVARGEVDAGFVYATDAAIMADKVRVALTVPLDRAVSYPLAITTTAAEQDEARRFVDFVLSPAGQAILQHHGFQKPAR